MSKITKRCCNSECTYEQTQDVDGECWGEVWAVDEWVYEDDSTWIHSCEGHVNVVLGNGNYIPQK